MGSQANVTPQITHKNLIESMKIVLCDHSIEQKQAVINVTRCGFFFFGGGGGLRGPSLALF